MSNFNSELLKSLCFDEEKFKEIMRSELEQGFNDLLQSELTGYLGYERHSSDGWNSGNSRNGFYERTLHSPYGDIHISVPRDRSGEFKQQTIPAYAQHTDGLENTVIELYKHGVTTREISEIIERMYGHHYSPSTVTAISSSIEEQVKAFHNRAIKSRYSVVYCDATYIHLRRDVVAAEALHVILGIDEAGQKEILDYGIFPTESAENYRSMLESLKRRGLEQVLLFVSDGLNGMQKTLQEVFPRAEYQSCWIHLIRNVQRIVRVSDRKEILAALKRVYGQRAEEDAKMMLSAFLDTFSHRYPKLAKLFEDKGNLFTFLKFPSSIQKSIYSTNLIERSNKMLKKQIRKKEQFPNEASLDRFVYTIYNKYNAEFSGKKHSGFAIAEPELAEWFEK